MVRYKRFSTESLSIFDCSSIQFHRGYSIMPRISISTDALLSRLLNLLKQFICYTADNNQQPFFSLSVYKERIESHNNQLPKPKFSLGHNEYSDLTEDEFSRRFKLGKYSSTAEFAKQDAQSLINNQAEVRTARHLNEDQLPLELPDSVNWIALGGVTPVKNQGACGSW
jgi:C1A family cysteine protease